MGDNIDKLFRDKLKDQKIEFNEEAWAGAQELLKDYNNKNFGGQSSVKKLDRKNKYIFSLILLLLIGITYSGYQWNDNRNINNNSLELTNNNDNSTNFKNKVNNTKSEISNNDIVRIGTNNDVASEEKGNDLIFKDKQTDEVEAYTNKIVRVDESDDHTYIKGTKVKRSDYGVFEKKNNEIAYPVTRKFKGKRLNKANTYTNDNNLELVDNLKKDLSYSNVLNSNEALLKNKSENKEAIVLNQISDVNRDVELKKENRKTSALHEDQILVKHKDSKEVNEAASDKDNLMANVKLRSSINFISPLPRVNERLDLYNSKKFIDLDYEIEEGISNNEIVPLPITNFNISLASYISLAFESDVKFEKKQIIGGIGFDLNLSRKLYFGSGVSYKYHNLKAPLLIDRVSGTHYGLRATDVVSTLYADQFHEFEIPLYVGYRVNNINFRAGMAMDYVFAAYGNANEGGLNGSTISRGWLSLNNYNEKYNYFGLASVSYGLGNGIEMGIATRMKLNKSLVNEVPLDKNEYSFKLFFNYFIF